MIEWSWSEFWNGFTFVFALIVLVALTVKFIGTR